MPAIVERDQLLEAMTDSDRYWLGVYRMLAKDRPGSFGATPRPIPLQAMVSYLQLFPGNAWELYEMVDAIEQPYLATAQERAELERRRKEAAAKTAAAAKQAPRGIARKR